MTPSEAPEGGRGEDAVAEPRYRAAFEEAPVGMALRGLDGRYVQVNGAFARFVGRRPDELRGLHFRDLTHPDDRDVDERLYEVLLRGEVPRYRIEKRYVRADGAVVWGELTVSLVRSGDAPLVLTSVVDVTERKAAEAALRRSEGRLRSIVDHVTDVLTILDADRRVRFASPSLRTVLGYAPEEFVGTDALAHVDPEDVPRLERVLAEHLPLPGSSARVEYRFRHKDGGWRVLESEGRNLVGVPGVDGILVLTRDVTERRRLEAEATLHQATVARQARLSALGTLVAGVAHEVNNPLTYVRGNVELALMDLDAGAGAETRGCLESALLGIDRIERVVKALRVVARQTNGERRVVDMNEVVRGVESLVHIGLADGVTARFATTATRLDVVASASEMHQVVLNLVRNAVDAGATNVWVETRDAKGLAQVVVADDGPGVPPAERARLFEPFYTTRADGTGLGLSIVHAIVHAHGGEIVVDDRPGGGARFRVSLPLAGVEVNATALRP